MNFLLKELDNSFIRKSSCSSISFFLLNMVWFTFALAVALECFLHKKTKFEIFFSNIFDTYGKLLLHFGGKSCRKSV